MSLKMNESPYQRSPRTTLRIMLELTAALLVVWLAAVIYNFTLSSDLGLRAILLMVVAVVFTAFIDAVVALMRHKKGANILCEVKDSVIRNYSYVTAIIFTLCCPVYVSYYVIIIGCLVSTGIKHCFGGFGKNIFNPAIIGRIFTGVAFADAFSPANSAYLNDLSVDLVSSSTLTDGYSKLNGKWLSGSLPEGFGLFKGLLGNYVGALGETFTILILVLGVILMLRKVINWRTSAFYLGTVAITAFFIGLFVEGLNPFTYVLYHLALGGLMFGAIFMITDPVTSPTSPFGKALIGVIAGLLTVLFRLHSTEGVMYSIAIINIISPTIDRLIVGRTTEGQGKKWGIIGGLVAASVVINTAISVSNAKENANNTSSSTSSSTVVLTREQKLFGLQTANYEETTLATLPTETRIQKVYVATGEVTALCYELVGTFPVETQGAQGNEFTATVGVTIEVSTNKVLSVNALDGTAGSAESYSGLGSGKVNTLLKDKTADEVALLDADAEFDITANPTIGGGAVYSSNALLQCAVEASQQYLLDKPVYLFDNAEVSYEKFTMTNNDANVQEAYTYTLEEVKYVSYVVLSKVEVEVYGMKFTPYISVTINTSNDTIEDIKIISSGATDSSYETTAQTALETKLEGKTVSEFVGTVGSNAIADGSTGATYSSRAIYDCVVLACTQYNTNDKVNLGGAQ